MVSNLWLDGEWPEGVTCQQTWPAGICQVVASRDLPAMVVGCLKSAGEREREYAHDAVADNM